MFDIQKYKNFARVQLKKRWAIPVVITIIITVINILFELPFFLKVLNSPELAEIMSTEYSSFFEYYIAIDNVLTQYSSTLTMIVRMIIEAVFSVAGIKVFLKMSRSPEKVNFTDFIEGFNDWLRAAGTSLWKFLWVTIWTMILVIPGIIKSIAYSQVFFLILHHLRQQ